MREFEVVDNWLKELEEHYELKAVEEELEHLKKEHEIIIGKMNEYSRSLHYLRSLNNV